MEQIKVNMTPCGFTPTIHASQNDNSTRKWGFELYDEDGKIDSSSIKEQMIFDSRVGGTEQILPENTSNPTTSPIIADIQYPDSLRSEQTFLYRESPTQEDGQAKITKIKGNTVKFNQLVQNGNFADTSNWNRSALASYSALNNIYSWTGNAQYNGIYQALNWISGHKYYFTIDIFGTNTSNRYRLQVNGSDKEVYGYYTNAWIKVNGIYNCALSRSGNFFICDMSSSEWTEIKTRNVMVIDLTLMNIGNLTTTQEVEAWLSSHIGNLPYYDYTTGKLLPFKGESLKTTGKNLCPPLQLNGAYLTSGQFSLLAGTYYISIKTKNYGIAYWMNGDYVSDKSTHTVTANSSNSFSFTVSQTSIVSMGARHNPADGTISISDIEEPMIRLSATTSDYDPYTSSTINLPTLDYFPTGMKSAGTVYDELTESKATARLRKSVVDGTNLTASYYGEYLGHHLFYVDLGTNQNITSDPLALLTNKYEASNVANMEDKRCRYQGTPGNVFNPNRIYWNDDSYSSASAMNTALQSSPLEIVSLLVAPTEESITTASLVTSKSETPLYYDNELVADCNEHISAESGIFDAKIKLMTDETIYSQKIQLHIEPKP